MAPSPRTNGTHRILGPLQLLDMYGFPLDLTAEEEATREKCFSTQMKATKRWDNYTDPARILRASKSRLKADQLKKKVRTGVPPSLRPLIWFYASGAAERQDLGGPKYYRRLLKEHKGEENKSTHVIDLDLPRTFPGNIHTCSEEGMAKLRRVLVAFAFHNPTIGYCQSLNYIAALLILVVNDEEKAFWVLVVLIEDILYRNTYSQDLMGCLVEQRVLKHLLDKKMPKLSRHLDELQCDISLIATEWLLTVYVKSMPAETAARVLDSVFQEGSKMLFRVALALFKLNEKALLETQHMGEAVQLMQRYTAHLHARDMFMKTAFDGIGSLAMSSVRKSRKTAQKIVEGELAERVMRRTQFQQERMEAANRMNGTATTSSQANTTKSATIEMKVERPDDRLTSDNDDDGSASGSSLSSEHLPTEQLPSAGPRSPSPPPESKPPPNTPSRKQSKKYNGEQTGKQTGRQTGKQTGKLQSESENSESDSSDECLLDSASETAAPHPDKQTLGNKEATDQPQKKRSLFK
eukprot:CAMPEP_0198203992 /NCGR_PEP_ID=MMETSP1445-20131203/7337_1 /TAXON_ID=36898 /ORGANISM="Pyramimonas sp., Strain CCMP2087" /LENGTH=521 /DNA_ID=CAMNT_0043875625 /DNA_START=375 /DNA_END=1937 /DNA_ORIENTATION=+